MNLYDEIGVERSADCYFNKLVEDGVKKLINKFGVDEDSFFGMVLDMCDGGSGLLDEWEKLVSSSISETEKKFNVKAVRDYFDEEDDEKPYWYKFKIRK